MIRRPANLFFASLGTLLALLIAAPLGAQPAPAVVRVTDPADLVAMGFGPGAIVYRAVGSGGADTPDEFGTTVSGYSAYMADQFHGRASDYAYSCTDCSGAVYYTGGDNFAHAQLEMPSGANFSGVRWWGFDDHAEDLAADTVQHVTGIQRPLLGFGFRKAGGSWRGPALSSPQAQATVRREDPPGRWKERSGQC